MLRNSPRLYWVLVCAFAICYLLVVIGAPLTVRGWSPHDDLYFLRTAWNLLHTGWMGPYDSMTLIKGPAYPAFIAANFMIGLPLLLTTQLTYVASCIALAAALTLYPIPRVAALLCYVAVLFNPITFIPEAFAGLRTEVYLAWTMFVVAGWMALPLGARRWKKATTICLGIATGLAFAAFWLTREEGPWIVPAIALFFLGFCYLFWRRGERRTIIRYSTGAAAAACACGVIILSVCIANYTHYRFFGTVDTRASGYLQAYQALTRVRPVEWKPHLPVPKEVRERIYAVSPAFAEIRDGLEGSGFRQQACNFASIKFACGDIASGWFLWALRDAVAGKGYYDRPDHAELFYRRLAMEVNLACDTKALACDSRGYELVPPLSKVILSMTFDSLKEIGERIAFMTDMPIGPSPGSGSELFPYVAGITHNRLTPTQDRNEMPYGAEDNMHSNGWIYHPDGVVDLHIEAAPGQFSASIIKRIPRPDVEADVKDPRAAMAGFDIEYRCKDPCYLIARTASGKEARFPVPRSGSNKGDDVNGFYIRYDVWDAGEQTHASIRLPPPLLLLQEIDGIKQAGRVMLVNIYRFLLPIALVAALLMLALAAWRRFVQGTCVSPELSLALCFVAAAAATRALLLALLDAVLTAPNGTSYDYSSPVAILYGLTLALCISLPFTRNRRSGTRGSTASPVTAQGVST
jgi:hypothetical protein